MAALENPRLEKLAQGLAQGMGVSEASAYAGFSPSPGAATRRAKRGNVRARVEELQERTAKRAEITAADLIEMLLEDRNGARTEGQYSAAVSAVDKVAKIAGVYAPEKREHTGKDGGPIETNDTSADRLAEAISELTEEERAAILPLLRKLQK